ncbi:50S ribosomal protein L21e [Candidatus Woesearchaeota archaeon]|nr:50S ribosomal protein L21e [Candidatus Woesearchaeota archaeon]
MAKRIGGSRRKSKHKLSKGIREKGKVTIPQYLQKFKLGEKVYLHIEPAVQKGAYHMRHMGKSGIIKEQSGNCYGVSIKDGGKEKLLMIHPVHLKRT